MLATDSTTFALDAAQPITPQITRYLRDSIIQGDLKPGNRISEAEIARACDVSRQPVREAFIRLAEQGLLAVLPQRGTIVSKIAYSAVLDARFLREAIEADIVAILVTTPDAALVTELRRQLDAQRALSASEKAAFMQCDDRFHRTLAEAAGKAGAWKLIEGLKSQMDRVRFLSLGQFPMGKLIAQHTAITERIEGGDGVAANAAIRMHLREVLHDLPQICGANPDYFDMPAGAVPLPVNAPIQGGDWT